MTGQEVRMKKMKHSKKYAKVKYYYDNGIWSIGRVYDAVGQGWITPEEYKEITGQDYIPK